jgi:hypothetical protein
MTRVQYRSEGQALIFLSVGFSTKQIPGEMHIS